MSLRIVGFTGSLSRPSKTRALVDLVTAKAAASLGATAATYDLTDLQPGLGIALDPVPLMIEGETLDPIAHFRSWRQIERLHAGSRNDRKTSLVEAIIDLRDDGLSYASIAAELNAAGEKTPSGKTWSTDNVRKLAASGTRQDP